MDTLGDRSRWALGWAFGLNAVMFVAEIIAALLIESVALFADSMDFLEDFALYGLAFLAVRWGQRAQARSSFVLAGAMAIPGLLALIFAIDKIISGGVPEPVTMGVFGALALAVNTACAVLLAGSRDDSTVLQAAWLSARNDVVTGLAIIAAAIFVARWTSAWPDILAGLLIAAINGWSAWKIARSALTDLRQAVD